jgi:hypothetical protein
LWEVVGQKVVAALIDGSIDGKGMMEESKDGKGKLEDNGRHNYVT